MIVESVFVLWGVKMKWDEVFSIVFGTNYIVNGFKKLFNFYYKFCGIFLIDFDKMIFCFFKNNRGNILNF